MCVCGCVFILHIYMYVCVCIKRKCERLFIWITFLYSLPSCPQAWAVAAGYKVNLILGVTRVNP